MTGTNSARPPIGGAAALICDIALIAAAAVILMLPWLIWGAPNGHSYSLNVVWVAEFTEQMAAGDPYPRWLDGIWAGAGGADFFFYAPLPFWLTGLLRLVICAACEADRLLVLSGVVWMTISGVGLRSLAGEFTGRWPAMAGAVVYMALPYHLGADWADRQALGEFASAAILPWHLAAFLACIQGVRASGVRLAVLTALVLLSHLPSALILATAYLVLFFRVARPLRWEPVIRLGVAAISGTGLAALYWYPALSLLDSVNYAFMNQGMYHWSAGLLTISSLRHNGVFFFGLWPPLLALSVVSAVAVVAFVPRCGTVPVWIVAALVALVWVMVTPLSLLIWQNTPFGVIQFPWRFLMVADVAFGLVAAFAVAALCAHDAGNLRRGIAAGVLAVMALVVAAEHPALRAERGRMPPPDLPLHLTAGAVEWLPAEVENAEALDNYYKAYELAWPLLNLPDVLAPGSGRFTAFSSSLRKRRFEAEVTTPTQVIIKQTYWRHWMLTDELTGDRITLRPSSRFPLTIARLPAGSGRYVLELPILVDEWIGLVISAISLLIIAAWWRLSRLRRR